jgi:hypothetical protein
VQSPLPTRDRPRIGGGGGGEGGGRRGPGRDLPEFPKDESLHAFLVFVHDLLAFWHDRVQLPDAEFADVDGEDRSAVREGWTEFEGQWGAAQDRLRAALRELDEDELRRRGLVGSAYTMKRHFIRKFRAQLQDAYESVAERLRIRPLWHKVFAAVDVVLDSAERALNVVPVAGAIVSGLKEFKETAMGVTEES